MMWRQHGDDRDDMAMTGTMGTTGTTLVETMETTAIGTTWRPSGGFGDDVGTMGMMWG